MLAMTPLTADRDGRGFTIINDELPNDARNRFQRVGAFTTAAGTDLFWPDTDAAELLGMGCPRGLGARATRAAVKRLLANRNQRAGNPF